MDAFPLGQKALIVLPGFQLLGHKVAGAGPVWQKSGVAHSPLFPRLAAIPRATLNFIEACHRLMHQARSNYTSARSQQFFCHPL